MSLYNVMEFVAGPTGGHLRGVPLYVLNFQMVCKCNIRLPIAFFVLPLHSLSICMYVIHAETPYLQFINVLCWKKGFCIDCTIFINHDHELITFLCLNPYRQSMVEDI